MKLKYSDEVKAIHQLQLQLHSLLLQQCKYVCAYLMKKINGIFRNYFSEKMNGKFVGNFAM